MEGTPLIAFVIICYISRIRRKCRVYVLAAISAASVMPVFAGLVRVGQMAWWEVRRMARGEMQRVARGQESWVARGEMSWVAGRQVALVARLNRGQVTGAGDIHGRMSAAHHALG